MQNIGLPKMHLFVCHIKTGLFAFAQIGYKKLSDEGEIGLSIWREISDVTVLKKGPILNRSA